ncbi:hypothetical protein [Labedaea rhizosphaerae]|uniref:Holliday junction resolvasome RuvABC endonuclease subunit n=1 Tax=Labedaea rhizosphaerae TaxID=598644 RepID=A0A4R6SGX8_LABRH|nr:hypothetical protein [Labedaea rhizosphaerae]TDQ01282.1 Holliday junction resolvasome RuvABC endonuclease subunit [Labedaea rhizosphaerae]
MTTTVIGIDPSLRRTGLARVTIPAERDPIAETRVRPSTGTRQATLTDRAARLAGITGYVLDYALPCHLAVIEGPSLGSGGVGSAWDRAGLWWRIVARLLGHDAPVAVVPPQTRAKWATGSGRADKETVRQAIARLWQPYWQPQHATDDNEADALVLASMGAHWLGLLPMAGPDPAALAGAAWPDREGIAA